MSWPLHAEVLDPTLLLGRLQRLRQHRADNPHHKRVSDEDLDEIQATLEKGLGTPRATYQGTAGGDRPPPVVHLPAHSKTSMFQSVIAHCVEPDLRVDELGERAPLEHWAAAIKDLFRQFGPCDPRWIEPRLYELLTRSNHEFVSAPSAPAELADEATVVLVGDWGTGLPQAINVAGQIRVKLNGAADGECHVIHLGDTYYSGLREEYEHRFLPDWPVDKGSNIKSWSLNGNHDMYSGGHGYFETLLGDDRFRTQNGSSNFWLSNEQWQIAGLDSAYASPDGATLGDAQVEWLRHVLNAGEASARQTILLSHHQGFSAYSDKAVNGALARDVAAALDGKRVAAWMWGHEHRCTVYGADVTTAGYDNLAGYTATIGHGGVPNLVAGPAAGAPVVVDRQLLVPETGGWEFDGSYTVEDDTWALGGFAVLRFDRQRLAVEYFDENGVSRHGPTAIARLSA